MRRRYRRKRSNSITSMVNDITHIVSRLSWWGSLVTGCTAYLFFSILLPSFVEFQLMSLEGNQFLPIAEIRLGRIIHVLNWVGVACFIVGLFFSIRNYFINQQAQENEKSIVSILSKIISRYID